MKKNLLKWIILFIAVAINIFIIVNASINGETSSVESGNFSKFMAAIFNLFRPGYINETNFDAFAAIIRKLAGHFGIFVADAFFSTYAFHLFLKKELKHRNIIFIGGSAIFGSIIASVSELVQIFTPQRYGSWLDILIDFSGYLLGLLFIISSLIFFNQIKFQKTENI